MSESRVKQLDQPLPFSRIDPQGRLLDCNAAYAAMCGYTREELIGKNHELILHEQMPRLLIERMYKTLLAGKPWSAPLLGKDKAGQRFWRDVYLMPLYNGSQIFAFGAVYHHVDVAVISRAEQLYPRLARGQSPYARIARLQHFFETKGPSCMLAAGVALGVWLGKIESVWGCCALAGIALTAWLDARRNSKEITSTLAGLDRVLYCDRLLEPLYTESLRSTGLLDMAFHSLSMRMRTLMGRTQINGQVLLDHAEESLSMAHSQASQLEQQLRETEQSAAAIHEMTATIQELSRNLHEAAAAASSADQLSQDGTQVALQSQASTEVLFTCVEDMGRAVSSLAQSIDAISGITQSIHSIAEQTNLLALNAAIEAARAGESGRGFAVVADEVRALAAHTRESTEQIQRSITQLRAASESALDTAQRGVKAARQSSDDVLQVQQALQNVCQEIGHISGMSSQMAAAIEQQGAVADEINRQITQIADLAHDSTRQARRGGEIGGELQRLAKAQLELAQRFRDG